MYLVCTRYVLGTYWYTLRKTIKRMRKIFRFEPWISCIASCALYHYATSMHSMVISMLNTWYIAPETYTCVARYLLPGCWLVSDIVCGSSRAPGSGHDVTGPDIDLNFQDTHFGSARDRP
jgi:hypothetical protein